MAVPSPGALSIVSPPPSWAARPWTIENPRPVPLPTPFVEKERLDRALARRLIHPRARVDDTEQHVVPGLRPGGVTSVHALPLREMVSAPPSGMASRAFTARFRIAISSWFGSAFAGGRLGGLDHGTLICRTER